MAQKQEKKSKKRKWMRYELGHSNSLRHTGWKMLRCGRRFLCCMDDASRLAAACGVFDNTSAANAL